jgi:hypothetical protein
VTGKRLSQADSTAFAADYAYVKETGLLAMHAAVPAVARHGRQLLADQQAGSAGLPDSDCVSECVMRRSWIRPASTPL